MLHSGRTQQAFKKLHPFCLDGHDIESMVLLKKGLVEYLTFLD